MAGGGGGVDESDPPKPSPSSQQHQSTKDTIMEGTWEHLKNIPEDDVEEIDDDSPEEVKVDPLKGCGDQNQVRRYLWTFKDQVPQLDSVSHFSTKSSVTLDSRDEEVQVHVVCSVCKKSFKSQTCLLEHIFEEKHYDRNCPACDEVFNTSSDYQNHVSICVPNAQGPGPAKETDGKVRKCSICDAWNIVIASDVVFDAHSHPDPIYNPSLVSFQCPSCPKTYNVRASLTNHISLKHKDVFPSLVTFQCPLCPKSYKIRASFTNHMAMKHGDASKKKEKVPVGTVCTKCGLRLSSPMERVRHQGVIHPKGLGSLVWAKIKEEDH